MIWCLFSIDNGYDQPANNLVAWWKEKPSLEVLASALNINFPGGKDKEIVSLVGIYRGEELEYNYVLYRLRLLCEGVVKENQDAS